MIAASEKVYCFSSLGLEAGQWLCFRNQWCSEPSFWLKGILIQWEDRLWRHWCFGSWSWAGERTEPSQDISDLPILARPPSQRPPLSSWRFSTTAPSLSSAGRVHPRGKITVGERICHRSCNGYILMYKKLDSKKKLTQMNLFAKQKQTHQLREPTSGYQRERVGWGGIVRDS